MVESDGSAHRSKVIVCILNWNNIDDTLECLESVLQSDYSALTVWLVDNASDADPTELVARRYPSVRVLRLNENKGYGGGNNVALERALAEGAAFILLLNNDVVVAPDMVKRLVGALEANPDVGMATPRVFFYDRRDVLFWDGGTIDWSRGDSFHDSRGLPTRAGLILSEWLDGSSLFVRASVVRQIGFFDDRYFLYYEDTEWSTRARRAGWSIAVVPNASCWHKVSRSTGGTTNPRVSYYYTRNRYLCFASNGLALGRRLSLLRYSRRAFRDYQRWRHDSAHRRAVLEACCDLVRGRWGCYVPHVNQRLLATLDALLFSAAITGAWLKSVGRVCRTLKRRSIPGERGAKSTQGSFCCDGAVDE
jgi:GT2 family glycosyltransferase